MFHACSPFDVSYDLAPTIINDEFREKVVPSREVAEVLAKAREYVLQQEAEAARAAEEAEARRSPKRTVRRPMEPEEEPVIASSMIDRFRFIEDDNRAATPRRSAPVLHTMRYGASVQVMLNPVPFVPSLPPRSPRTPRQERKMLAAQGARMAARLAGRRRERKAMGAL